MNTGVRPNIWSVKSVEVKGECVIGLWSRGDYVACLSEADPVAVAGRRRRCVPHSPA